MAEYKGNANEARRAMQIMKKRQQALEDLEMKKRKLEEDLKLPTIDTKFAKYDGAIESQLKSTTVGLVTLDQMRQKQEDAVKERDKQLAQKNNDSGNNLIIKPEISTRSGIDKKSKTLTYYDESDQDSSDDSSCDEKIKANRKDLSSDKEVERLSSIPDGNQINKTPTKLTKTPLEIDVDTSFLPNQKREEEERVLRENLAAEWRIRQQKLKEEEIDITFSYWDGSGHRKVVRMKKGNSIYEFLKACLETLRKDFNELRSVSADQLMYVKEDLIIPHHYTFYDFIVTKARGKSGPLFAFDVHDDIRLVADSTVEKDESHAGKVLLRSWYERNKHIFPSSRWEPYDPTKTYEKYTISDKRNK